MNKQTFYALIVGSVPPSAEVIAKGDDEEFARAHLKLWLIDHPLGEFEEAIVVKVVADGPAIQPSVSVGIKLASLAVHADEMIETGITAPGNALFDLQALQSLLVDPEVQAYLETLRPLALLPEKR